MKSFVIGIMPQDQIRKRVLAIARGDYKPKPSEPKIWFTSMKSVAEVQSDENRALLRVIAETAPESISALAQPPGAKSFIISARAQQPEKQNWPRSSDILAAYSLHIMQNEYKQRLSLIKNKAPHTEPNAK
ncbi:hypothetical protein [Ottowia caeni]|uniref:HVO_A0114 family putative DNA-binding protein n=1 Tax=Ottowia caeni TaxID=2870339 RepID=UPI001E5D882D